MTRMWFVPPMMMCRNHLLGEHGELHQAVGTIANHPHGEAMLEGHCHEDKPDDIDTSLIPFRHQQLADEMDRRGYDHKSELPEYDDPEIGFIGPHDIKINMDELALKCANCRRRRMTLWSRS